MRLPKIVPWIWRLLKPRSYTLLGQMVSGPSIRRKFTSINLILGTVRPQQQLPLGMELPVSAKLENFLTRDNTHIIESEQSIIYRGKAPSRPHKARTGPTQPLTIPSYPNCLMTLYDSPTAFYEVRVLGPASWPARRSLRPPFGKDTDGFDGRAQAPSLLIISNSR